VFVFPTKTADPETAARLQYRYCDDLAGNPAKALKKLLSGECGERIAVCGFDEAIAERIERGAQGLNIRAIQDAFLDRGIDRAIID